MQFLAEEKKMTKALYFDCFSGISGDMTLGALLDLGLSLDELRRELAKLNLSGWKIAARQEMRGYISGTRALVDAPEQHHHRHLADIRLIIESSTLSERVKAQSMHIFRLLADAEAKVHGLSPDEVHFHEVGALDAIIDIVGTAIGLELLEIDEVFASPLPLGSGWIQAAHGWLPLPAPATLNLLAEAGAPTVPDTLRTELVTPTGAAILAALATFERPPLRLQGVGYGLGMRDLERPNVLRVWLGERLAPEGEERPEEHHHHHYHR